MAGRAETARINGRKGGRPKGSKERQTLEREELLRLFRARVAQNFQPVLDALFQAALGVSHLMAKDRHGQWTEVTDPAVMAQVLNREERFYRIYAHNPDLRALKDILDRTFGSPTRAVDLTMTGSVDLIERLQRGRKRAQD